MSERLQGLLKQYLQNHCENSDVEGMGSLCECKICLETRKALKSLDGAKTWQDLLELEGATSPETKEAAFLRIFARVHREGKHWDTNETMARCFEDMADRIEQRAKISTASDSQPSS